MLSNAPIDICRLFLLRSLPVADPESPARVLLAGELTEFLQEVRDNLPGTIADVDTEFLHDVRVAVRRTRSVLKLGRSAFPAHVREVWEPQFKWLGELSTPVRDLDVPAGPA
jgi:CHAD domain-containing protein